ncbi:hypothetical protein Smp_168030 [Schistosoma mansoni]|uniref:SRPBCC family protein n=1 Tax=Schistosoma mansoni TaxID=6183 RepID=C4QK17_SCHMA|nr:hypothetical protein Smp_168030 [Schistosoma mansoni]|eukprot:XP_018644352.1 hypothetical protein Smp_168030 [Schistosoma mansoni]
MEFLGRYECLVDIKKWRSTLKENLSYTKGKEIHITPLNLIQTSEVTTAKFQDTLAGFVGPILSRLRNYLEDMMFRKYITRVMESLY